MAFNFNWSPLMADAGFYTRAQDLLTAALNKSPKPPIIVDDIVVTELNLGSNPPELEILEIGDLAEDRFRGIFKMSYAGDAVLTLKTCVQANPLNTYLLTRHPFTSPQPLAAATGLTIPLQITLSDIKLSGFVILVFSKQKGITVVFRNDPLESLKVSSTFDSIPFVRDYLQKEIEGQLRILFMDELPAIIHRLSLRLWSTEYSELETTCDQVTNPSLEGPGQDPLLNPPQDPVDSFGNVLSISEIASLSLDSGVEMHSLFSRKNALRIAALTDSQRTLSLFTPSIREVVFRAWTGSIEQADGPSGLVSPMSPPLSRTQSHITVASAPLSSQDTASVASSQSRPGLPSSGYSGYGLSLGAARHSKAHACKRKKRVIDLRPHRKPTDDMASISGESSCTDSTITTTTKSAASVYSSSIIPEENNDDDPVTPPVSPVRNSTVRRRQTLRDRIVDRDDAERTNIRRPPIPAEFGHEFPLRPTQPLPSNEIDRNVTSPNPKPEDSHHFQPPRQDTAPIRNIPSAPLGPPAPAPIPASASASASAYPPEKPTYTQSFPPSFMEVAHNGSILEQAWMMKMASEIARRIQDENSSAMGSYVGSGSGSGGFWDRSHTPPPAYRH
ncbi:mitochondrial distribution and morphology protein 34 [Paracoccidioides brasiliensis]|uniref:Mitochondrial distribution and morphology protein 34 n=1 Tax=Paracoccidioides brasiliensis TaxID=121759 RepID=A0A1D2J387_PARBR|nr:mitochondrial distribution and morphology protein 34 [Paracoccidioides brasiliensis]